MSTDTIDFFSLNIGLSAFSLLFEFLVATLVMCCICFRISRIPMLRLAEKLPGPTGYPLIGNALEFVTSSEDIFRNVIKHTAEFDQIIKFWIGSILLTFILDPRDIEIILSSPTYSKKSYEYRFFKPWLGNGLLISEGQKWELHRKLIAPTFHLSVLKSFIDKFNANSQAVVKKIRREGDKEFNCHDYLGESVFHSLGEDKYQMAVLKICDIIQLRTTRFWLRSDLIFNFTNHGKDQTKVLNLIHSLSKNFIQLKKMDYDARKRNFIETTDNKDAKMASVDGLSFGQSAGMKDDLDVDDNDVAEKKRLPFLDRLMEASQKENILTEQEVSDQVNTIMFEGHDSVAVASSFFLSMMGCHLDVQENVIRELDGIFGASDRPCSFQDTLEMNYLERCLMETLRLYPPVPIIGSQINTDVKLASGNYTIPRGSSIVIGTFVLHRSPKLYPNPNTFNPDNFLSEKTKSRHHYAFIPFSAGPRSYVGRKYAMLKLKILLSTIMRNFRVKSNIKECDFRLQCNILLKRIEGFQIFLESRK